MGPSSCPSEKTYAFPDVESVLRNQVAPTVSRSSPKRFSGRRASATSPVAMNDHPTISEKAMKPWLTVSLRAIATYDR